MRWRSEVTVRLRALFSRRTMERELDEELSFHLEKETEKNLRAGMDRVEARRRALAAFGGVERHREAAREARGVRGLEDVARDVRYAVRGLVRLPVFTVAAVLTLALGIGANTAVFSAVDSLILHPLPFVDGNRIVYGWMTYPKSGVLLMAQSAVVEAWAARSHSFSATTTYSGGTLALATDAGRRNVNVDYIDAHYLGFLGLRPILGRAFTAAETAPGAPDVAMLAYGEWKSRYGGATDVLGRRLNLGGQSRVVVGVAPPTADGLNSGPHAAFFLPLEGDAVLAGNSTAPRYIQFAGRLRAGVTVEQADQELTGIMSQVKDVKMPLDGWQAKLMRPQDFLDSSLRTTLLVLVGAVALVLLIACANVGSLLMARAGAREREMAVRTTLGAGRGRLVRQLLTESTLLALAGGGLGTVLAEWGLRGVSRMRPESLSDLDSVAIDHRALLFTGGVVILATLLFGLYPALRASSSAPANELKTGMGDDMRRARMRTPVTAVEVALSVVLLMGAGLLVRTLLALDHQNPGFRADGVAMATYTYPKQGYTDDASQAVFETDLVARARSLPGVTGTMVTLDMPLEYGFLTGGWEVRERGTDTDVAQGLKAGAWVPPEYFKLLGIPLLKGHTFDRGTGHAGNGNSPIIVSRSLARAMAPDGGSVLGMHARSSGHQSDWYTVIGVVGDVAALSMRGGKRNRYQVYFPMRGSGFSSQMPRILVARTTGDAVALTAELRKIVQTADPNVTVMKTETARAVIRWSLSSSRFYATILTGFALLALLLASVGLFGVLSYGVQRRRREIAVRVALGASITDVRTDVVRQALLPVVVGLVLGVALSAATTRVLSSLLFGVSSLDPTTLAAVGVVVLATALLASWIPVRRATRIDPMATLRAE